MVYNFLKRCKFCLNKSTINEYSLIVDLINSSEPMFEFCVICVQHIYLLNNEYDSINIHELKGICNIFNKINITNNEDCICNLNYCVCNEDIINLRFEKLKSEYNEDELEKFKNVNITIRFEDLQKELVKVSSFYKNDLVENINYIYSNFKTEKELSDYLKIIRIKNKDQQKKFQCEICEASFKSAATQKKHIISKHTSIRYKCTICNKIFSNKSTLRIHINKHDIGSKKYSEFTMVISL